MFRFLILYLLTCAAEDRFGMYVAENFEKSSLGFNLEEKLLLIFEKRFRFALVFGWHSWTALAFAIWRSVNL